MTTPDPAPAVVPEARLARGLMARALMLAGLFAVAHLLGWRENTSVICGMSPITGSNAWMAAGAGLVYVICYLLATMVAPVLFLAGVFLYGWGQWRRRKEGAP